MASNSRESTCTFDIILLFGPSIPNKANYVPSSLLSRNHTVICPCKLYAENPDLGLRDVALKVVNALKQQKQVVIIDELRLQTTRKSLVEAVKKKFPSCRVMLLQIIPRYGFMQVMWLQQLANAKGEALHPWEEENFQRQWFEKSLKNIDYSSGYVDTPTKDEGYAIQEVLMPLQVKSCFKLEFPALLIQWEGAINDSEELRAGLENLSFKWIAQNPCGHIIIICDGKKVVKGIQTSSQENCNIKRCLKELASLLGHPVYALQLSSTTGLGKFNNPPNPGMIAFLHMRHLLDLHSKQTCYLFESSEHKRMAEAAGVRYMKMSQALKSPDMVIKGYGISPPVPDMLQSIDIIKPKISDEVKDLSVFCLPMFEERQHMKDGHFSKKFQNGLEEHVFVKDTEAFTKYQELCATEVMATDHLSRKQASCSDKSGEVKISVKRYASHELDLEDRDMTSIPVWMQRKRSKEDTKQTPVSLLEKCSSEESARTDSRSSRTVYVMSEKEIMGMAHQLLLLSGQTTGTMDRQEQKPDQENG